VGDVRRQASTSPPSFQSHKFPKRKLNQVTTDEKHLCKRSSRHHRFGASDLGVQHGLEGGASANRRRADV
jgi:hypothetical protein